MVIRYSGSKYDGESGAPYDKFLEAFELSCRRRSGSIDASIL